MSPASSYNQIDFDLSTKNVSYGPGFLRAKKNGIKGINAYKRTQIDTNILNSNIEFDNGQRVFHQKFGMGLIISSDGDKLNINFGLRKFESFKKKLDFSKLSWDEYKFEIKKKNSLIISLESLHEKTLINFSELLFSIQLFPWDNNNVVLM